MRRTGLILLLSMIAAAEVAWGATASDFTFGTVTKIGTEAYDLPYRLLTPPGYSAATRYPLIVFLHGVGELGTDDQAQLNNNANGALALVSTANQTAYPCFMIAPQAHSAWDADTLGQIVRLIGQLEGSYSIDADRLYATGLSLGGGGTWSLITAYPNEFAAAVPMSGWGAGSYGSIVDIPVWDFHAANDPTVPVGDSDSAVAGLRGAGGRVIYTRYDTGGHGIWPVAYQTPGLMAWLMAQRRNQPVTGTPILSITTPATATVANAGATMTLAGSAAFPGGGITQVQWTTDLSAFTTATGTTSWSASGVAVPSGATRFSVLATGPSWSSSYAGATTVSDSVRVVRGSADVTPPTISITTPTIPASTTASTVTVGGHASDAGGVQQITWSSDRGGQGTAQGTTAWSIPAVDLAAGANVITVTAYDNADLATSATITVTYTPTSGSGSSASSGSSHKCGHGMTVAALVLGMLLIGGAGFSRRSDRRGNSRAS